MRASASAGVALSVVLLSHGCDAPRSQGERSKEEPVRRASFRSLAARDFLLSCPRGVRAEMTYQLRRLEELRQLAARKGAGYAVWLGENDWAGLARYETRERCEAGDEAYRQALAAFAGTLDALAGHIADYRQ